MPQRPTKPAARLRYRALFALLSSLRGENAQAFLDSLDVTYDLQH